MLSSRYLHLRRCYCTSRVQSQIKQYSLVKAGVEDLDVIIRFLGKYHYVQVPTLNHFQINFMDVSERLRDDTYHQLSEGLSSVIRDEKTHEMVGVSIMHTFKGCLGEYYRQLVARFKDSPARYHWGLLGSVYRNVDLYKEYNVDTILHGRLFCLKPKVQKLGVSNLFVNHLDASREKLHSQGHNLVLFSGESNGAFSNAKMDLLGGYRSKVMYEDFNMEGEYPLAEIPKVTPHSFVTLRVIELMKPED